MPNLTKRQFTTGLSTLAFLPQLTEASESTVILDARPGKMQLVSGSYPETQIWGFNGGAPGPEIRVQQGTRLCRKLINNLSQPTSVHWHGIRIDNAMDGVPGLTQQAVAPREDFTYEFDLPDAGTYWYHSHNQSTEQVARGLYGVLVVEEKQAPEVDHDIVVVVDDWRLKQDAQINDDFGQMHDWTHGGRMGNYIHAKIAPELTEVKQNQRIRLRLVNVATDRIMQVAVRGMTGSIVALDGMPLENPKQKDHVLLAPAQRADFIVDVTGETGETAALLLREGGQDYILDEFLISGRASQVSHTGILPLPSNPIQRLLSVIDTQRVILNMEGGAMGGLNQGIYKGKTMAVQELVNNGQIWTLNGVAGLPEKPLTTVQKGETLVVSIRNNTVFAHAMHMHGNHFQEVLTNNELGPLRDTILLDRGETKDVAFIATNPGDWLFHCHMLSHQAAGMKTWIKVTT